MPHTIRQLKTSQIRLAPKLFQFKSKCDSNGKNGVLDGLRWNAVVSNVLVCFEPAFNPDRIVYVVDGHQRFNLALEAEKAGAKGITLTCRILHESDGVTPERARVIGAVKNIAENAESTRPYDVALLIRNGGSLGLVDSYIHSKNRNYQCAKNLCGCSDRLFHDLAAYTLDDYLIAEVVTAYDDDNTRRKVLDSLQAAGMTTSDKATIKLVSDMGFTGVEQETLFGTDTTYTTNMENLAKILRSIKAKLSKSIKLYTTATDKRDELESVGNAMNHEANVRLLGSVTGLSKNLHSLIAYSPEITKAAKEAVAMYGKSPAKAERILLDALTVESEKRNAALAA